MTLRGCGQNSRAPPRKPSRPIFRSAFILIINTPPHAHIDNNYDHDMGLSLEFTVPEGYYPPFTIISDSDHGGWIIIATTLGLAMSLLATAIRIYVKWMSRQGAGVDDALLAAATVFAFVLESVILAACAEGLGRSVSLLDSNEIRRVEKSFYAAQILTIFTLGFCKCSVACFIVRLKPQASVRRTLNVFTTCVAAWMVASIFAFALQCQLGSPWALASGACDGVWTRILVIGALDCALELGLFGCAMLLVMRLQTRFYKKFIVLFAFGLRLPIIALIAARLNTFDRFDIANFARTETLYIVWTVTQINYSLISTTLPILRPFIKELTTFYGALRPSEYSDSNSRTISYPMSSFRTSKRSDTANTGSRVNGSVAKQGGTDMFDFGAARAGLEPTTYTEIEAQEAGPSRSVGRSSGEPDMSSNSLEITNSQTMIIRVETELVVTSSDAA